MRALLFCLAVLACACGGSETSGSATTTGTTTETPTAETQPPQPPSPVPPPTGRSIVRSAQPFSVEGTIPDAEWLADVALQRAARCYTQSPSRQGVIEARIAIAADGTVSEVGLARDELHDETVAACLRQEIGRLRGRPIASPGTIVVGWRFETIHDVDVDRDCVEDSECGLVTGLCEGPVAARRATADRLDGENRARLATVRCAEAHVVPALARCREGYCAAVPADHPEWRGCASASECVAVARRCGMEAVASAHRAEAEAAFAAEREGLVCDPSPGDGPAPACAAGFCTLEWAAPQAP